MWSDVIRLQLMKLDQELQEHVQLAVIYTSRPSRALNSVWFLARKVLFQIINDQSPFE